MKITRTASIGNVYVKERDEAVWVSRRERRRSVGRGLVRVLEDYKNGESQTEMCLNGFSSKYIIDQYRNLERYFGLQEAAIEYYVSTAGYGCLRFKWFDQYDT